MYGDRTFYLKCPENNALSPKELGEEKKKKASILGMETARVGSIREVSELAPLQPSSNVTGTPRDQLSSLQSGKLMSQKPIFKLCK